MCFASCHDEQIVLFQCSHTFKSEGVLPFALDLLSYNHDFRYDSRIQFRQGDGPQLLI